MFSYKPLMRQLLERDMNKKMLKEALGLSPVTMAKFSKNEPVSMETLDCLCNYFGCEIEDIIKHIKN
jgi:putative transcriptional regulator